MDHTDSAILQLSKAVLAIGKSTVSELILEDVERGPAYQSILTAIGEMKHLRALTLYSYDTGLDIHLPESLRELNLFDATVDNMRRIAPVLASSNVTQFTFGSIDGNPCAPLGYGVDVLPGSNVTER
jgi:hypothetical protein